MNKRVVVIIIIVIAILSLWGARRIFEKRSALPTSTESTDTSSYWTCPMHPQVHQDRPGECPICHMRLVQVRNKSDSMNQKDEAEGRSPVDATSSQLHLGIQTNSRK